MKLNQYVLLMLSVVFAASLAQAQTSSTGALPDGTSTVQVNPEVKEDDKKFSVDLGIEMSENVVKEENAPKQNTTSVTIAPSYKINSLLTVAGRVIINQENYGQHETKNSDGTLSLGIVGYQFTPELKSTHSIGTLIPATEKTIEDDRLKGNISTTNGLSYSTDYFSVGYKLGLLQNFHEFTQNRAGSPNIQYRVSHIIELKVPVTEKFAVSGSGVYRTGYTYNDFERYGFIFDADLSYSFLENLTANIGTSNDGAALKANGVDSNIALYNENTSVYRAGLAYSY